LPPLPCSTRRERSWNTLSVSLSVNSDAVWRLSRPLRLVRKRNDTLRRRSERGAQALWTVRRCYGRLDALACGADPNHLSHWGRRALHHALGQCNGLRYFERLLDHGADPTLLDGRRRRRWRSRRVWVGGRDQNRNSLCL
jgi:hypothetical protein